MLNDFISIAYYLFQKHLILHLDMSGVKVGTEYLTFNISAYTKSEDNNLHQNFQQLHLNLTTDANISIIG
jgi:type III secretory pathway component EscU